MSKMSTSKYSFSLAYTLYTVYKHHSITSNAIGLYGGVKTRMLLEQKREKKLMIFFIFDIKKFTVIHPYLNGQRIEHKSPKRTIVICQNAFYRSLTMNFHVFLAFVEFFCESFIFVLFSLYLLVVFSILEVRSLQMKPCVIRIFRLCFFL